MSLTDYITLGRSGLRVSPLSLGTMTFGTEWGWGSDENAAREIFNRYIDSGGNFIDTANGYTQGTSERMIGKFIRERGLRDRVALATKFTFNTDPANPNAGGNGRKNIYGALEASLRRLETDYVDLYWLHAWDTVTPVEEVVSTLSDLVRAGRIRYYGFSDTPAWYLSRAFTLAEHEGKDRLIALQLEYSLVERNIEREHLPAAQQFGLALCPWSPLAGGFLSGKYQRETSGSRGEGRLETTRSNPIIERFTERNWRILDALLEVAKRMDKPPAQVALNWVATQPGVTSTIIGATRISQLDSNVAAIDFSIPPDLRKRLDQASALEPLHPYLFFAEPFRTMINGTAPPRAWQPAALTGAPQPAPAPAEAKAAGQR